MGKKTVKLFLLAAGILACVLVLACGKKNDSDASEETSADTSAETEPETGEYQDWYTGVVNPLTGIADLDPDAEGKRPVAIMVNNVPQAMPQLGIGEADIVFELPVEGYQTRFMAMYADYQNLPYICSIRSYRYYFAAVLCGFDAIYVHWGEDTTMMDYYYSLNMDTYDGMTNSTLFGRDKERLSEGYALEHTSCFYGDKFPEALEEDGVRTDLDDEYLGTVFNYYDEDKDWTGSEDPVKVGGDCLGAYISFGGQSAGLYYDADDQVYYKDNNGDAQIDGTTGEQLSFTNVIIFETGTLVRDDVGHLIIDWNGGIGYLLTGGGVIPITWSKETEYTQFEIFDENGNEITLNKGKTYIAYCQVGSTELCYREEHVAAHRN